MATWKGRQPAVDAGDGLPSEIAGGPSVALWCSERVSVPPWVDSAEYERSRKVDAARTAWLRAGDAWGAEQGLRRGGWQTLLPKDVHYFACTALGRCHADSGEVVLPWDE
jgi:hypothetical protein